VRDDDDDDDDVMTTFMRIISQCSSYLTKSNREINLPVDSATFMVRQAVLLTFLYPTKEHQDQGGTQSLTKDACRKEQYSHRRTPFHSRFVLKRIFIPFLLLFSYVTSCFLGKGTGIIEQCCGI
jgi:hypothetical protein